MTHDACSVSYGSGLLVRSTHDAARMTKGMGFTLIELVIGIAILITALLGLLGVFVGVHALNESARNQTVATHLADRIMEEIRNSDFQTEIQPNAQAPTDANWVAWAAAHNLALTDANLTSVSVDFDPPFEGGEPENWPATNDPLRIQVRVNWVERGNRNRVTYLETLVTKRN